MVLLCFVLDLRSLSPPFLDDLKQAMLELGNFYAVSSWRSDQQSDLLDRIGLCYLFFNRISSSHEMKVAYSPRGNFSLRDFHLAVNSLPNDAFSPDFNETASVCSHDGNLSSVFSDEVLYSWGDQYTARKVILLTSYIDGNIDSVTRKTLRDAAEKCVSVEFVLLERKSSHLLYTPEDINDFVKQICDLENCCFHSYLPDLQILNGLVKRWLWDLKDDMEEPLQARFIFKSNLVGSVNSIYCNLSLSASQMVDGFNSYQTCRCHGVPVDDVVRNKVKGPLACPITGQDLQALDLIENAVKVGKQTILFMPSFHSCLKLRQVSLPIAFNVIERTNLGSLSEGVIIGTSYFATPSTCHENEALSDEIDNSELNAQLFKGLCCALHSLDQGLVCSSNCNIETMRETTFLCYYILQPSDGGPMLLRVYTQPPSLSEIFDLQGQRKSCLFLISINQSIDSSVTKEIENSIQASLLKMELGDYNPVLHERGFHQKLNLLVKESLQFGSILTDKVATSESNSTHLDSPEVIVLSNSATDLTVKEDGMPQLDHASGEDKSIASIAEEWEQLIVTEVSKISSPNTISRPKLEQSVLSQLDSSRQLDVNTSRILERLEAPRRLKTRSVSPIISSTASTDAGVPIKKSVLPLQPIRVADNRLSLIASQPMKPTFQRIKRKLK